MLILMAEKCIYSKYVQNLTNRLFRNIFSRATVQRFVNKFPYWDIFMQKICCVFREHNPFRQLRRLGDFAILLNSILLFLKNKTTFAGAFYIFLGNKFSQIFVEVCGINFYFYRKNTIIASLKIVIWLKFVFTSFSKEAN